MRSLAPVLTPPVLMPVLVLALRWADWAWPKTLGAPAGLRRAAAEPVLGGAPIAAPGGNPVEPHGRHQETAARLISVEAGASPAPDEMPATATQLLIDCRGGLHGQPCCAGNTNHQSIVVFG